MHIQVLEIAGIRPAIQAMRLPMKSGSKSDSGYCDYEFSPKCNHCPHAEWNESGDGMICRYPTDEICGYWAIGPKDHELSMKLCAAGSDHRKHIRLIDVWVEIQAPLYWWKEFDTYRLGVDKVSESTMHTLMKNPITIDDFEMSKGAKSLMEAPDNVVDKRSWLDHMNGLREHGDFEDLNALLPNSYLQKRIVKVSYEALRNMYLARRNHKLKEWREFCKWIEALPYSEFIISTNAGYGRPNVKTKEREMLTLDDRYVITADSCNVVLNYVVKPEDADAAVLARMGRERATEDKLKPVGYYSDVSGALAAYIKTKTRGAIAHNEVESLQDLRALLRDLTDIAETFRGAI